MLLLLILRCALSRRQTTGPSTRHRPTLAATRATDSELLIVRSGLSRARGHQQHSFRTSIDAQGFERSGQERCVVLAATVTEAVDTAERQFLLLSLRLPDCLARRVCRQPNIIVEHM